MKYEYNIVCVKKIARTKFDIGHCPIKVKVNVSPQNIFLLVTMSDYITQLW